jgi:hypothetical protein
MDFELATAEYSAAEVGVARADRKNFEFGA